MSLRRTPEEMLRNITKERNSLLVELNSAKRECEERILHLEGKVLNATNPKERLAAEKDLVKERTKCMQIMERITKKVDKLSGNVEARTSKLSMAATKKNKKTVNASLNSNSALANVLGIAVATGMTRRKRRTPNEIAANKAIEEAERLAKAAAKAEEKALKDAVIAAEKERKAAEKRNTKARKEAEKQAEIAKLKAEKEAKLAEALALKEASATAKAVEKVEKVIRAYPAYTKHISNTLKKSGTKMKGPNVIKFVSNFKKAHPNTYNTFKTTRSVNEARIMAHLRRNKNTKPYNPFNEMNEEINFNLSNSNNNNNNTKKNTKPYNPFNDF